MNVDKHAFEIQTKIVSLPLLTVDWLIVIIVFADDVASLTETLSQLSTKSLSKEIQIIASDTPALRALCSTYALPTQFLLPEKVSKAVYWQTILSALDYQGARTVFLRAACGMPTQWDARLMAVLDETQALAVSPLCARQTLFSLFTKPARAHLSVDEIDQWLVEYASGTSFDAPVILDCAAALQGKAWRDLLAETTSDSDLFATMRQQGHVLLGTDQVYIDDSLLSQRNINVALPAAWEQALIESHPLMGLRHALMEINERNEIPTVMSDCLPVQLQVGHSWGGGLGRWIEDAVAADTAHQNLVLRPLGDRSAFGKSLALYRGAEMDVPIKTWLLAQPIISTAISHYQYQQVLMEIIQDFKVERLMISSFIAQSLDLLRTGLPTTIICHDFYPFCPAVVATFDTPCIQCDSNKLRTCLTENEHHRFFIQDSVAHWEAIRSTFIPLILQDNITLVAPVESVASRYKSLVPAWQEKLIHIIPHGLSNDLLTQLAAIRRPCALQTYARLRIVVLGSVVAQKGGEILDVTLPKLTQFADVYLLGAGDAGDAYRNMAGVTVISKYERTALAEVLASVEADLGLLLSTVPETFSFTLSELWAAGIPVLASRLGAFSDRIRDGENGWLVAATPEAVCEKLRTLHNERSYIFVAQTGVQAQPLRSSQAMMADYYQMEPRSLGIPRRRFFLARKQYKNLYSQTGRKQVSPALHIDTQVPFRQVLSDFLLYTEHKIAHSPRLPSWPRRALARLIRWVK